MSNKTVKSTGIVEVDNSLDLFIEDRVKKITLLHHQTVENVVEIGRTLLEIKSQVEVGEYEKVLKNRLKMLKQTAWNYTNLATIWDENPEYREGISNLALSNAYFIAKKSFPSEVRSIVLKMSEEGDPPKLKEVQDANQVIEDYRQHKLGEFDEIDDEAKVMLYDNPLAENEEQLKRLSNLSKRSQRIVAEIISEGEADNCRDALRLHKERQKEKEEKATSNSNPTPSFSNNDSTSNQSLKDSSLKEKEESNPSQQTLEIPFSSPSTAFNYKYLGSNWRNDLQDMEKESLDFIFCEAPMKHQFYLDGGYQDLFFKANELLKEGGFLLTTVGHKSAMFIGHETAPLEPLHLLTIRRQPGRTRSIVGINIACASVMLALAYKKPYRSPKTMLVDLQTIGEKGEGEDVETGIEAGVERFLETLVPKQSRMLHLVCSKEEHFNLRDKLIEVAKSKIEVSDFFAVG